jgi:FdrA protein
VLLDVVIGHGASDDPAGPVASVLAEMPTADGGPVVVAFVVGTAADPQHLATQEETLRRAGAVVARSSTEAARIAGHVLTARHVRAAS